MEIAWDVVENDYYVESGNLVMARPRVYRINQACVLSDRIQVDAVVYSEVPPVVPGTCGWYLNWAPIYCTAISLPPSSLPVSVSGIGSVSIDQGYGTVVPTASATSTPTCACTGDTSTPTATPTETATSGLPACPNTASWGDSTAGAGTVSPAGMSQAQRYTLAQDATVKTIWVGLAAPATLRVGIYGGSPASYWPSNLLYSSDYQPMADGLNPVAVPDLPLPAGTYWLAYASQGGAPATLQAASGSTALHAYLPTDFSCNWMSCSYVPCNAPTATPVGPGTPTPTPTVMCTPPPFGIPSNQGVIYAEVCR